MTRASLLFSDVHLSAEVGQGAAQALETLLIDHVGAELILVGDILDLSLLPAGVTPAQGAPAALAPHERLVQRLRQHVRTGGSITWVPGNHDAGVEGADAVLALRQFLTVPDDRQLTLAPWFLRRGNTHIEHGHLYDRDCAPNHPLAEHDVRSEGLGTALMRRFVAPHDAFVFAHAHSTTPLSGLATAFSKWGPKAPALIASYFRTAFGLCLETQTHRSRVVGDQKWGDAQLTAHTERVGVPVSQLRELLAELPEPTHHSFCATFHRLYFDRILASLALGAGVALLGLRGLGVAACAPPLVGTSGALLSALGAGFLARNLFSASPRYVGPVTSLDRAAALVARTTGAENVIFGHTHVEVNRPGYTNLGSFGFARGERPYSLLGDDGRLERRAVPI